MRESAIIEEIKKRAGKAPGGVKLGIGDDCAVLDHNKSEYLLWAADMLVEGTHFRIKDAGYKKIGRKAVAVNVSDIAAMGGIPRYITVSLGLPPKFSASAVRALTDGIFDICGKYGISVIGGDTNRSSKLVIDVSVIGTVGKKRLVRRSGAKDGDLILITGPVRNGRKEHLDIVPRLKESKFITVRYKVSSMIDVSDGIAPDVAHICAESSVGCRLYAGEIPLSSGLSLKDALHYGESFELLFTMSGTEAERLLKNTASSGKKKYFIIGQVTPKRGGMKIVDKKGGVKVLKAEGYRHL